MDRRVDESPTVELITSSGLGVAGGGFGAAAGLTADLAGLFSEMGTGIDSGLVAFQPGRDLAGPTTLEQVLTALVA